MGHEFMGVVEEVGPSVARVKKGDRIVAPFSISCGQCEWCRMRLPTQCVATGRAVFGGRFGKQYPGGQAERIRVPFADHMCETVPADMADEDAFFLGDILSTGYCCAENAGIRPGDSVAIFGAGPVGLLALQSAHLFGPARIFVVDRVGYRLKLAEELGGIPVNLDRGHPAEQLRALTGGRGPDAVLVFGDTNSTLAGALVTHSGGLVSVETAPPRAKSRARRTLTTRQHGPRGGSDRGRRPRPERSATAVGGGHDGESSSSCYADRPDGRYPCAA